MIATKVATAIALLAFGPIQCISKGQVNVCEIGCQDRGAEMTFLVTAGGNNIDCWCSNWQAFAISRGKDGYDPEKQYREICKALENDQ
jgi:hypothetical protein